MQAAGAAAAQIGRLLLGVALAFAVGGPLGIISAPSTWVWGGLGVGAGLLAVSMGLLGDGRRLLADFLTSVALAALVIAGVFVRTYFLRQPHELSGQEITTAVIGFAVFLAAFATQATLRKPHR